IRNSEIRERLEDILGRLDERIRKFCHGKDLGESRVDGDGSSLFIYSELFFTHDNILGGYLKWQENPLPGNCLMYYFKRRDLTGFQEWIWSERHRQVPRDEFRRNLLECLRYVREVRESLEPGERKALESLVTF